MAVDVATLGGRLRIAATHASLPGHFPGDPIVPGVVLLDHVAASLERAGFTLAKLSAVKFLAPLRPDEDAVLRFEGDARRLRFRIERDDNPILAGEATLA
ncbi:MAG: hydroxymyristoyl-ACP dehydratase [Xanthomonadales bacterium]|nr:hydroxymyristoyl-ACP dehydratase [Xanthomonadales bacterium]